MEAFSTSITTSTSSSSTSSTSNPLPPSYIQTPLSCPICHRPLKHERSLRAHLTSARHNVVNKFVLEDIVACLREGREWKPYKGDMAGFDRDGHIGREKVNAAVVGTTQTEEGTRGLKGNVFGGKIGTDMIDFEESETEDENDDDDYGNDEDDEANDSQDDEINTENSITIAQNKLKDRNDKKERIRKHIGKHYLFFKHSYVDKTLSTKFAPNSRGEMVVMKVGTSLTFPSKITSTSAATNESESESGDGDTIYSYSYLTTETLKYLKYSKLTHVNNAPLQGLTMKEIQGHLRSAVRPLTLSFQARIPRTSTKTATYEGEENEDKFVPSNRYLTTKKQIVSEKVVKPKTALHPFLTYASNLQLIEMQAYTKDFTPSMLSELHKQTDRHGSNALHFSAGSGGTTSIFSYLISSCNFDVNSVTAQKRTALHWACRNGHLATCKVLVREFNADVRMETEDGTGCLCWAFWMGRLDVVEWLLDGGYEENRDDGGREEEERSKRSRNNGTNGTPPTTPLQASSTPQLQPTPTNTNTDANTIQAIPPNCLFTPFELNTPNKYGCTPLHFLALTGSVPSLKYYISKGGDWRERNNVGHDCVFKCCWKGNLGMLEYLWNEFVVAKVAKGKDGVMSECLNCGDREMFVRLDYNGFSPLDVAKLSGVGAVVEWLGKVLKRDVYEEERKLAGFGSDSYISGEEEGEEEDGDEY